VVPRHTVTGKNEHCEGICWEDGGRHHTNVWLYSSSRGREKKERSSGRVCDGVWVGRWKKCNRFGVRGGLAAIRKQCGRVAAVLQTGDLIHGLCGQRLLERN
jgi:hypothetical protein